MTQTQNSKATAPSPRLPRAWRAQHLMHQTLVLLIAALAAYFVARDSPVFQGLLDPLPRLLLPGGIVIPLAQLVPPLVPLLLGLPLALTRHRAPLLLWTALMILFATLGILEVARLNWAAFAGGVAFRVETGPVPIIRSTAGLLLVLCGMLLLAQQAVHQYVRLLIQRGVPRRQLAIVRNQLLRWERLLVAGAFLGGTVLLLVTAISMHLTERAPREAPWFIPALIWTGILLGVIAGTVAYLARTTKTQQEESPTGFTP